MSAQNEPVVPPLSYMFKGGPWNGQVRLFLQTSWGKKSGEIFARYAKVEHDRARRLITLAWGGGEA